MTTLTRNIERITINQIRTDGGTQARADLNDDTVAQYAEDMQDGATFPAIILYYDGDHYWLADGFHRLAAAKKNGQDDIAAEIRLGARRDAVLHAVGANAQHGLRRSRADKRRAVLMLLQDEEWSQWSNRQIARKARVSEKTVRNYRDKLSAENPQIAPKTRKVQRNGQTYTMAIDDIGAQDNNEKRPEPPPTHMPEIWELENEIWDWLTKFDDKLAPMENVRNHYMGLAWDQITEKLRKAGKRYKRGDLKQAVNNVYDQLQEKRADYPEWDASNFDPYIPNQPTFGGELVCPNCHQRSINWKGDNTGHCDNCENRVMVSQKRGKDQYLTEKQARKEEKSELPSSYTLWPADLDPNHCPDCSATRNQLRDLNWYSDEYGKCLHCATSVLKRGDEQGYYLAKDKNGAKILLPAIQEWTRETDTNATTLKEMAENPADPLRQTLYLWLKNDGRSPLMEMGNALILLANDDEPKPAAKPEEIDGDEWYTPEWLIDMARQVMGEIDLDPASSDAAQEVVNAYRYYTKKRDALTINWLGRHNGPHIYPARVWLNPPYSHPLIGQFVDKLLEQVEEEYVGEWMLLTNNNTETEWWHRAAAAADAICFFRSRIFFWRPGREDSSPRQGQTLFYFGENVDRFRDVFSEKGIVIEVGHDHPD
jgi:phage N-6-adenine-methyltransferase